MTSEREGLLPASAVGAPSRDSRLSRRVVLRGMGGLIGAASLAACGSQPSPAPLTPAATEQPRLWLDGERLTDRQGDDRGGSVDPRTLPRRSRPRPGLTSDQPIDNSSIGNTIDDYLAGAPEDLLMFVTGYPMRRVAGRACSSRSTMSGRASDRRFQLLSRRRRPARTAALRPWSAHGPWAVFYRKSLFADRGLRDPPTWTDYLALAKRMQLDGIAPMAMADAEQFEALGTFDILNLRLNGYAFHTGLLAGRERWTDRRVHEVFDLFRELLTTAQPDAVGRAWGDAVTDLVEKRAGMLYFGMFATSSPALSADVVPDLGLFAFPDLGTVFGAEKAVEDPSDAFVIPRNSPDLAADLDNAKAFLEYFSKPAVQSALAAAAGGPGSLPAVDVGPAGTTLLRNEAAQIVRAAQHATRLPRPRHEGRVRKPVRRHAEGLPARARAGHGRVPHEGAGRVDDVA